MFNLNKKISALTFIFAASLFGFLIYSNTLYSPFIFDDLWYIQGNHVIRDLSNFTNFLYTPVYGTARYVNLLSLAINYYFGGLNTFGYHLVNIVIHILNAILVYLLVILTFSVLSLRGALAPKQSQSEIASALPRNDIAPNFIAFSVALIFLVHPIQTLAVTYISQRAASLATFFYLLAIVLYIKSRLSSLNRSSSFWIPYVLSIFFTILAMKTKEISFTLPFIITLYEFTFFKRFERLERFKRFLYLIPYLLTLVIIPLDIFLDIFFIGKGRIADAIGSLPRYHYLLTQFSVIVKYIRLLFFPINQHFGPDHPISASIFETRTFLSFIFLISIFTFTIYLYIRSRKTNNTYGLLASFGIFWFFITLSVESSIIPIKDVIFEYRLYLPSIGFILSVTASYFYLFDCVKNKIIKIFLSLFIIIVVLSLSLATYKQNNIYKDTLTVWLNEVKYSPKGLHNRNELGAAYFSKNMLDEAEREFKKAIELDPHDFESAYAGIRLAVVYERKGLFDDAEKEYKTAIEVLKYASITSSVMPAGGFGVIEAEAHTRLGELYYKKGLFYMAVPEYKKAIKLDPSATVYNKLGIVYYEEGMLDKAIEAFKEAVKLEKEFAAPYYSNIGFMYFKKSDYDKAIEMHGKALNIDPKFANAHYGFGEVYEKNGINDKAVEHYKEYIKYADPKEKFVEKAKKKIMELEKK